VGRIGGYNVGVTSVYLETSFFSACVSTRTGDKIAGWRASSREWWKTQAAHFALFISPEVFRELSAPEFPNRDAALKMLEGINLLQPSEDVQRLAALLVSERIMPGPAIEGDALHVAYATLKRMDFMLTWNVKHLANPNKRTHFGIFCMRLGLPMPQIVTPDLLSGDDDEPCPNIFT
jgi:hypothetical protein